jgi:hypothetical protein
MGPAAVRVGLSCHVKPAAQLQNAACEERTSYNHTKPISSATAIKSGTGIDADMSNVLPDHKPRLYVRPFTLLLNVNCRLHL